MGRQRGGLNCAGHECRFGVRSTPGCVAGKSSLASKQPIQMCFSKMPHGRSLLGHSLETVLSPDRSVCRCHRSTTRGPDDVLRNIRAA